MCAALLTLPALADEGEGRRFSHARHAEHLAAAERPAATCAQKMLQADAPPALACGACHALAAAPSYSPLPPPMKRGRARAHEVCECCHRRSFTPGPICASCHPEGRGGRGTYFAREREGEPALKEPEFSLRFPHPPHVTAAAATWPDRPCGGCHGHEERHPAGERPPRWSHERCAPCHAGGEGIKVAAPIMTDCAGCHLSRPDKMPAPEARPWSVAGAFRHDDNHQACADCHAAGAGFLHPPKPACARCHDGVHAFKLTGFACARCHGERS